MIHTSDERQGLDVFQFAMWRDEPDLAHAVFGRAGGVSEPPFDSLNVGSDVQDAPDNVRRNHEIVCEAMGVDVSDLVMVRQVHSNRVAPVTGADRGRRVGELDGLFTDEPGVPLILRFADCVPLLAYDATRGVLGVAHAGWRGTLAKIGQALVGAMCERMGSRPADVWVGIGPSIGPCCYEVGPEVIHAARDAFGVEGASRVLEFNNGRPHLDLWEANRLQLERAGVGRVEVAGLCTACRRDRFFSHRGDRGRTGRFPMLAFLR